MTRSSFSALVIFTLVAGGCSGSDSSDEGNATSDEDVATVTAALSSVPADVTCVSFTLSGSTTGTRRFTVTPSASGVKLDLGRLPLGSITLGPVAHNVACSSITTSSVATWVGGNVSANVTPGVVTEIPIVLRQNVPVGANVDFIGVAQSIGTGHFASYAVLTNGTVRSWGLNSNGQLGDGTRTDRLLAGPVSSLTGVKKVAAGNSHACALTTSGQVYCWGNGWNGQLGNNSQLGTSTPSVVSGSASYRDLGCGEYDTCAALTAGNGFHCWGDNTYGQLNEFSVTNRLVPTYANGLGGGDFDLLVVGERTTYSFGGNESRCDGAATNGQLGNGGNTESATMGWTACHVNSGARFIIAADAGPNHSCAVEASLGKVYCSGLGGSGALGSGSTTSTLVPVEVVGLSNATAVATGWDHTCALRGDGSVWCWGRNDSGQLGDGTGTSRTTPVQVAALSSVTQIIVANNHSCALKSDGSMWCWGNNDYGQLGNGNKSNRATATRVQL